MAICTVDNKSVFGKGSPPSIDQTFPFLISRRAKFVITVASNTSGQRG